METRLDQLLYLSNNLRNRRVNALGLEILSILIGFFTSTALSTIPVQAGDWGIIAAAIIVVSQEIVSKINYQNHASTGCKINISAKACLQHCNSIKLGILYGLFVDAFKLGS